MSATTGIVTSASVSSIRPSCGWVERVCTDLGGYRAWLDTSHDHRKEIAL